MDQSSNESKSSNSFPINEKITKFIEECNKNLSLYNSIMEKLFSSLNEAVKLLNQHSFPKYSSSQILKNMEKNALKIQKYLNDLNESENQKIYASLSCIYGAFLGDATGAYCEFNPPSKNNVSRIFKGNPIFGDTPGQVTDDSEMAMSMAYAILTNPSFKNLNSIYLYYYYGAWYKSGPRDIGNTTRNALHSFNFKNYNPFDEIYIKNFKKTIKSIKQYNNYSLANGFLMRISPFITWCFFRFYDIMKNIYLKENNSDDLVKLFKIIKEQATNDNNCTHPAESLHTATAIFTILATCAMFKLEAKEILNNIKKLLNNSYFENNIKRKESENIVKGMILNEINTYENRGNEINVWDYFTNEKSIYKSMGYYVHAFRLTLYYLFYFDKYSSDDKNNYTKYRVIMNEICTFGGDTDTNAAIVGAVLGPLIGYKNFGKEFEKMISIISEYRYIFSPCLMVLYVHFLNESNIKEKAGKEGYFLDMMLNFMYGDIDEKFFVKKIGDEKKIEDIDE